MAVQTVTGPIAPELLGRTLMHEHVLIGYPGGEVDTIRPGHSRREMLAIATDRVAEMRGEGIATMIDPCPADLLRDVEIAAEISTRTGFRIVVATGLYHETEGGSPYWKSRMALGGSQVNAMAELFEKEIRDGVGSTGIKAGIIKVATSKGKVTEYEEQVLRAAVKASLSTGAPITTHTDAGTMGDEQQRIFVDAGLPAHRAVIGHACGTDDHAYHMKIARGGSYLGFDRFGLDFIFPDEKRTSSLLALLRKGAGDRIVVSHDTVWCWKGEPLGGSNLLQQAEKTWRVSHFTKVIAPKLLAGGAKPEDIDKLLVDNPRNFFRGDALAKLAA